MPGLTRETAWIQNSMTSMILSLSLLQRNLVASALLLVSVRSSNMASCHRSMGLMLRLWEMNSLMRWEPEMMNGWLVWTEQHDAVVGCGYQTSVRPAHDKHNKFSFPSFPLTEIGKVTTITTPFWLVCWWRLLHTPPCTLTLTFIHLQSQQHQLWVLWYLLSTMLRL